MKYKIIDIETYLTLTLFAGALFIIVALSGCAITHEVQGDADIYYHVDPIEIVTSVNITVPSGNYAISDNVLIIYENN